MVSRQSVKAIFRLATVIELIFREIMCGFLSWPSLAECRSPFERFSAHLMGFSRHFEVCANNQRWTLSWVSLPVLSGKTLKVPFQQILARAIFDRKFLQRRSSSALRVNDSQHNTNFKHLYIIQRPGAVIGTLTPYPMQQLLAPSMNIKNKWDCRIRL